HHDAAALVRHVRHRPRPLPGAHRRVSFRGPGPSDGGRVSRLPRRVETGRAAPGRALRARREARAQAATLGLMHIPSPPVNGFHLGPLYIHYYGLMYVIGITLAI